MGEQPHKVTTWEPTEKVMIERYTQTSPEDAVPDGFHKCFHYDTLKNQITGLDVFRRCPIYVKPIDNYCWAHRDDAFKIKRKCKLCNTKLLTAGGSDYCEYHSRGVSIVDGDGQHWAFEDGEIIPHPDDELAQTASAATKSLDDCGCGGFCLEHAQPNSLDHTPMSKKEADEEEAFNAIVENVDWQYVGQIGWGKLKYRQARKQYTMENVHFRIECKGKRDDVDLFHAMIASCDSDYPLDPFRSNTKSPEECDFCHGNVWKRAVLTPVDLKKAAKQAGIRIKVREYLTDTACAKKAKAAKA